MSANDMPLSVHQLTPAEAAEWDAFEAQERPGIDRVSCLHCLNRSGLRCQPRDMTCVPLDVKHDCAHYRARQRRAA